MNSKLKSQWFLACAVSLGAAVLWLGVLQRIAPMLTLEWKVGDPRITAGTGSLTVLLVGAAACATIGLVLAKAAHPPVSRVAGAAAGATVLAALTWLALIASPLVELVSR